MHGMDRSKAFFWCCCLIADGLVCCVSVCVLSRFRPLFLVVFLSILPIPLEQQEGLYPNPRPSVPAAACVGLVWWRSPIRCGIFPILSLGTRASRSSPASLTHTQHLDQGHQKASRTEKNDALPCFCLFLFGFVCEEILGGGTSEQSTGRQESGDVECTQGTRQTRRLCASIARLPWIGNSLVLKP